MIDPNTTNPKYTNIIDSDDDENEDVPPVLVSIKHQPYDKINEISNKIIPVTILTGFLGAGKSTLLNYILTNNSNKRIAIIENEFSQGLGIEGMIVKSGLNGSNIENFFELNNGCICCTVKDDLLTTLEQLALHKDRFEYILIETTGLANPGKLISIFWADDALDSALKLDGVVTVVDALNMGRYMNSVDTCADFTAQIAYADRILINKSDLVDSNELETVSLTIKRINAYAELKHTSHAVVDTSWLLYTDSFSADRVTTVEHALSSSMSFLDNSMCYEVGKFSHISTAIVTHGFYYEGEFDMSLLSKYLDKLLYNGGTKTIDNEVFRMKGILRVANKDKLYFLQAVHELFSIEPSVMTNDRSDFRSKLIVIGKNLDRDLLERSLKSCMISTKGQI